METVTEPLQPAVRALWMLATDQPKADTVSLARWVRAMDRRRLSLTVAFLSPPTGTLGPAGEFVAADGSRQTVADSLRAGGAEVVYWPGATVLRRGWARAAERFIRDRGVRIVHSVNLRADLAAAMLRKRIAALIWLVRPAGIGQFRRTRLYAGDWFDRRVYRRADAFAAISHAAAVDWAARLRRPMNDFEVIYNCVPPLPAGLTPRDEIRRRLGVGANEQLILSASRLDREKGVELLVDAAAAVVGDVPSARWVVLGDGPMRGRLENQVRVRRLERVFALRGSSDAVWSHLGAADLFVLPSRMEGCPNALLEAMSAGAPIVATAVGAVPELVADQREALLVAPTSDGLAAGMRRLLTDAPLASRLAIAAKQRAAAFAPARAAERYHALYERLAGRE
ncbi:MAG: glycosyltransferase family 4 protein [Phycisphaerae bacterium]|nr:glycosyltransferase family 4 protein [Phycisphaerae bacterium]